MKKDFPKAVPEIPVTDIGKAQAYYRDCLGFHIDWDDSGGGGIGGISKGHCRMFLTNAAFREGYGNKGPVLVWINLDSKKEVDELHTEWSAAGARIVSAPEDKPWLLREFTMADLDGNLFRVFYDFRGDLEQK
jgi:predicted lactoylglutathione lyase